MALGPAAYDIVIGDGLLTQLSETLAAACPVARYAVIADATVAEKFGRAVLEAANRVAPSDLFTFPAGERNKTAEQWQELSERLLAAGLGRDGAIVALGGGVSGDLAGFVAATYMRGVPYIQIPTTLLAMIDSSIGGKTGVDTAHGKNLIGAFHQPRAVVADVTTLSELPPVHFAAGMAEALKHGAIADREYVDWIERDRQAILARDTEALVELVRRSVQIKAAVVAEDERETGKRAILNFGHTVAHAIEAASGYEVLHGEAVAMGMVAEAELGTRIGVTEAGTSEALREALISFNLPIDPPKKSPAHLLEAMQRDKKVRAGSVRFALLKRVGEPARRNTDNWTFEVPEREIISVLGPRV